jgi:hypothetical protein
MHSIVLRCPALPLIFTASLQCAIDANIIDAAAAAIKRNREAVATTIHCQQISSLLTQGLLNQNEYVAAAVH